MKRMLLVGALVLVPLNSIGMHHNPQYLNRPRYNSPARTINNAPIVEETKKQTGEEIRKREEKFKNEEHLRNSRKKINTK